MEGAVNSKISRADRKRIRAQFPALAGETVFLENAGGSQVPLCVADRIHDSGPVGATDMRQSYRDPGNAREHEEIEMVERCRTQLYPDFTWTGLRNYPLTKLQLVDPTMFFEE